MSICPLTRKLTIENKKVPRVKAQCIPCHHLKFPQSRFHDRHDNLCLFCLQLDEGKKDPLQQLLGQHSPDDETIELRKFALTSLREIVRETFGSCCEVKIFGSVASATDLKTSDVDIVVVSVPHLEPLTLLDVLERKFKELVKGEAPKGKPQKSRGATCKDLGPATCANSNDDAPLLVAVRGARIPLLKVDKRLWGVDLDISFNSTDGLTNTRFVKSLVDRPDLKPLQMLVRLVKLWKDARDLPDARCFGLGSFAWLLMATFALQSCQCSDKCLPEIALRNFFRCFVNFDYHTSAVCVRGNRGVAVAKPCQMQDNYLPARLVVLDPCTHPLAPPRNVIPGLRTAQMILVHAELERAHQLLDSGAAASVFSSDGVCTLTDRLARFQPASSAAASSSHIDLVLVLGSGRLQTIRIARVLELRWRNDAPSPSTRDVVDLGVQLFASTDTTRGAAADRFMLKADVMYAVPADIICVADMELCENSKKYWRPSALCQERLKRFHSSLLSLRTVAVKPTKRPRVDQSLRSADASRMRFTHSRPRWMAPPPREFLRDRSVPVPFAHPPGGGQGTRMWANWARPSYSHSNHHYRNNQHARRRLNIPHARPHNNGRFQWRPPEHRLQR